MRRFGSGAVALILSLLVPVAAQANPDVFTFALPRTVWVISPVSDQLQSTGTGVVVSTRDRWVLTVYHVTKDRPDVWVMFPRQDDAGELITSPAFYKERLGRLAIRGRVIATDAAHDLALIQLEHLPAGMDALPLAETSPRIGEALHLIGNSGAGGQTMWRYGPGKVRSVFDRTWTAEGMAFQSRVIENQIPGNAGDSGGPVINDRGELVGIHHGETRGQNGLAYAIDVREIRRFLARHWSVVGGTWVCRLDDGTIREKRFFVGGGFRYTQYGPDGAITRQTDGSFTYMDGTVRLYLNQQSWDQAQITWASADRITATRQNGYRTTWVRQ
jgi:S1-C subfamily serine protease